MYSIYHTWKKDEDFGRFLVLPPAVLVFAEHWVTDVLSSVCTCCVDQSQDVVSLVLDNPAGTKHKTRQGTYRPELIL